jgi:hypothetical protein
VVDAAFEFLATLDEFLLGVGEFRDLLVETLEIVQLALFLPEDLASEVLAARGDGLAGLLVALLDLRLETVASFFEAFLLGHEVEDGLLDAFQFVAELFDGVVGTLVFVFETVEEGVHAGVQQVRRPVSETHSRT